MSIISSLLLLRKNPLIQKLPPYLSLLCLVIGLTWLLLLPLPQYSRHTYVSENALLPGQVHTYFAGSDQNIFRAFKHEIDALGEGNNTVVNDRLETFFKAAGLKVARQDYRYESSGDVYEGQNVYAILHAPRGDATEAIVLIGAWRNVEGVLNRSGVALVLTLARYFKRWSLWSKDIIFLITPDSMAGPQAWVDAYHDSHDQHTVDSLPLKSGALQGALAIDYPFDHRFESLHIVYDGVNGQLPNLDLFNTVVSIASGQMGIGCSLQQMWKHTDAYEDRLRTMLKGMLKQALGHASGPHSSFIPYHVDAITLQPYGEGWQDEMAMGRVVESTFRSLNNLLEHLHQSFFFYFLMHANRFVSIGTYLPSAMLVAASFSIMSIFLWLKTGRSGSQAVDAPREKDGFEDVSEKASLMAGMVSETRGPANQDVVVTAAPPIGTNRYVFRPLVLVAGVQFLGLIPLYVFNHTPANMLTTSFTIFTALELILPTTISHLVSRTMHLEPAQYNLVKCFSLLFLGMVLASLATLNFSLSLLIGILASPLIYIRPFPRSAIARLLASVLLRVPAPTTVVLVAAYVWDISIQEILSVSAFGWNVWGVRTMVVVWCVWWPAWILGNVIVLAEG